jgi:uncharacterized protein (DUF1501 family)
MHAIPLARASSGSRALVCVYLFGGTDSNSMVIPMSGYDGYAAYRGSLAVPKDSLISVRSGADQVDYGFHPALAEMAALFQSGAVALVNAVGASSRPDFADQHLSYFPYGYAAPAWAAQMAGVTAADRRSLFTDFSSLLYPNRKSSLSLIAPGVSATDSLRQTVYETAQRGGDSLPLFPQTGLGQQLRQVAALIQASGSLGMQQQVFLVAGSGFGFPVSDQTSVFRELSSAMGAFYAAMTGIGMAQNVTTYTDTEFARSLRPNNSGAGDPGWAGFQLVMGGGVLGGSVFGTGTNSIDPRGIFPPAITKDQYHATLANWFGVPHSELTRHLPGLGNLTRPTVGFMVTG